MRKLRPAEIKMLKFMSKDTFEENGRKIFNGGHYYLRDFPKYSSVATLQNLYKLGLIRHGYLNFYCCSFKITDKGKELLITTHST